MTGPGTAVPRLITFEGGEGAGKTTHIRALAEAIRGTGEDVVTTREPGGSPAAEAIRRLILDPESHWAPLSEALLHMAARHEHLQETVTPALTRGAWVLCDRFIDSTLAYQGYGQGVDLSTIHTLNRMVVGGMRPCLTVVLDVAVEEGLRRAHGRRQRLDRYETMTRTLHERLRQGYLEIAASEPGRCAVIDANRAWDAVQTDILAVVRDRLGLVE